MLTPMRMPGAKPAMNRSAMEVLAMEPYTTMVMDGGMTETLRYCRPSCGKVWDLASEATYDA